MIPVLSAQQVRSADAYTIASEPISSIDLMERAARACAQWLMRRFPQDQAYLVLAGCGNNGGDGLAIARLLAEAGCGVRVWLCRHRAELREDARTQEERARRAKVAVLDLVEGSILPDPAENEVVVDALLGTGLDRPVSGWLKDLIVAVNQWPNLVVAIDLPSGLFAEDNSSNDPRGIIQAEEVLTFEVPKLALLLPDNGLHVGRWYILPIGLNRGFIDELDSRNLLVERTDVHELLPARTRTAHKGSFGRALLLAGGTGKVGAALLAARACARSGAGSITVQIPPDLQPIIHAGLPEAMTTADALDRRTGSGAGAPFAAVGIGPGMGTGPDQAAVLKRFIQDASSPLVLDADALTILGENRTWLAFLPKRTILTPHPKEFERLTEKATSGFDRLERARAFAVRFGLVVVLKGANTAICSPDGTVHFNATGNPGMARGGSGDALTGVITALLAQGLEPISAAVAGVYLHGLAGDLAAEELGPDGMLPSDLIEHLPLAWKRIRAST